MTRVALTVPPGGSIGVFGVERQSNSGGGIRIIQAFRLALLDRFPSYAFDTETVLESEAWVEGAELLALTVTASAYTLPNDIGHGIEALPSNLGNLSMELVPERGREFLPAGLFRALRNKSVKGSDIIGFRNAEVQDTFVTVSRDGRKKTFSLDQERVPAIRVLLTGDGERALVSIDFLRKYQAEVRDYFQEMGHTWSDSWQDGQRSKADLNPAMQPPSTAE